MERVTTRLLELKTIKHIDNYVFYAFIRELGFSVVSVLLIRNSHWQKCEAFEWFVA
jgi:hypothetical protein